MLGKFTARLFFDADQDVVRTTEFLHLDIAQIERRQFGADRTDIGRTIGLDLDDRTALEVDAVVQADQ